MNSAKCEALQASVELGSFTAAAKQLGYTPSGITRMIDALEAELGVVLVHRKRTGVKLTSEGEALYQPFADYMRASKRIVEIASNLRGVVQGHVTVGTYYSVAAHWLPKIIAAFQEEFPQVTLAVKEGGNRELSEMLKDGEVDCCITSERLVRGRWMPLKEDPLVAWIPNSWKQASMRTISVRELSRLPFIMPLPGEDNDVDALFKESGKQPDIRFTVKDGYTAWRMVEAGLGVSVNNLLMSHGWSGDVATVPIESGRNVRLGIETDGKSRLSPALERFVEYVVKGVEGL